MQNLVRCLPKRDQKHLVEYRPVLYPPRQLHVYGVGNAIKEF